MAARVEAYIERHSACLKQLLAELVRIPTVNPPGQNYLPFVRAVQPQLRSLGMKTEIVRVPAAYARRFIANADEYPRASLIGRLDAGADRTLHFNCHYDVVPAAGNWRYGPFEPKERRGWIYGRGSSDMKGAIAAVCFALRALRDLNIRPRMNVEVSLTPDEETGGDLGAGHVVRQGHVKADYAIVCEGGSGREVGCGHNGVIWLEAAVAGKAAHASSPQDGVNAFEKMAALVMHLQSLKTGFGRRAFRAPNGKKMHPTLNIGGVFAVGEGAKVNTVPALATFTMDRRVTPGERLSDAERELRAAVRAAGKQVRKLRVSLSRLLAIDPCHVDPAGELPRAFAAAVREVRGGRIGFSVSRGFTDMHFFVKDAGIPTIGYGPGGRHAHAIDEAVRVRDLVACAKVYARFMAEWPCQALPSPVRRQ
jgi:succinyl-diaminopimelate desuccinylase